MSIERKDYIDTIIVHDDNNICGFFYEYRYLSNYHKCNILYNGITYSSTEAAYQAAKSLDVEIHKLFSKMEPSQSKREGKKLKIRNDWDNIKTQIMYDINLIKYTVHEDLRKLLLDTGDKYLEETNYWGDVYWGTTFGHGKNMLGKTLMNIRSELRGEEHKYTLWNKGIIL